MVERRSQGLLKRMVHLETILKKPIQLPPPSIQLKFSTVSAQRQEERRHLTMTSDVILFGEDFTYLQENKVDEKTIFINRLKSHICKKERDVTNLEGKSQIFTHVLKFKKKLYRKQKIK